MIDMMTRAELALLRSTPNLAEHISRRDDVLLSAVIRGLELVDSPHARWEWAAETWATTTGQRLAALAGYGPSATRDAAIGDPRAWSDAL